MARKNIGAPTVGHLYLAAANFVAFISEPFGGF